MNQGAAAPLADVGRSIGSLTGPNEGVRSSPEVDGWREIHKVLLHCYS